MFCGGLRCILGNAHGLDYLIYNSTILLALMQPGNLKDVGALTVSPFVYAITRAKDLLGATHAIENGRELSPCVLETLMASRC